MGDKLPGYPTRYVNPDKEALKIIKGRILRELNTKTTATIPDCEGVAHLARALRDLNEVKV